VAFPLQTQLIQFVVHGSQRNIVRCTVLTIFAVTLIMTHALYRVCSV